MRKEKKRNAKEEHYYITNKRIIVYNKQSGEYSWGYINNLINYYKQNSAQANGGFHSLIFHIPIQRYKPKDNKVNVSVNGINVNNLEAINEPIQTVSVAVNKDKYNLSYVELIAIDEPDKVIEIVKSVNGNLVNNPNAKQ